MGVVSGRGLSVAIFAGMDAARGVSLRSLAWLWIWACA